MILYLLLSGKVPFPWHDFDDMTQRIVRGEYYGLSSEISESARKLVHFLLQPNPKFRLTMAQVLKHEWFCVGYTPESGWDEAPTAAEDLGVGDVVHQETTAPGGAEAPISADIGTLLAGAASAIRGRLEALSQRSDSEFSQPYTCFVITGCGDPKALEGQLQALLQKLGFAMTASDEPFVVRARYEGRSRTFQRSKPS